MARPQGAVSPVLKISVWSSDADGFVELPRHKRTYDDTPSFVSDSNLILVCWQVMIFTIHMLDSILLLEQIA